MNKKLFWIDTETTGLDAQKNDIIQLAYLVEIGGAIKEEGNLKLQPFSYDNIDKGALEVNKMSIASLKTFPSPNSVYRSLQSVLSKYVDKYNKNDKFSPAGYNVRFDADFLKQFFVKNNDKYYGSFFDYHVLDPITLLYTLEYKGLVKLDSYRLENVCKYFGIELSAHDALSDIKATRELFLKLLPYLKEKI